MPIINIFSTMKTPIRLRLFRQVTDPSGHGDFSTAHVRSLALDDGVLLAPNATTPVDQNFWNSWTQQNASSTLLLHHVIFPA
jgi:hypothetical protein